jgi:hypothetical protein
MIAVSIVRPSITFTMFDFLFKRGNSRASTSVTPANLSASSERTKSAPNAKQEALAQAQALGGNESAAVDFILKSQFADARLAAATHVASR